VIAYCEFFALKGLILYLHYATLTVVGRYINYQFHHWIIFCSFWTENQKPILWTTKIQTQRLQRQHQPLKPHQQRPLRQQKARYKP